MIIYQKNLFKLIPKSISKFPKVWKIWKWKLLCRNHAFLFLFPLTLDSFKSNRWQNQKRSLVLNYQKSSLYEKKLAQLNRNLQKRKELYLLLCHASMLKPSVAFSVLYLSKANYLPNIKQLYYSKTTRSFWLLPAVSKHYQFLWDSEFVIIRRKDFRTNNKRP